MGLEPLIRNKRVIVCAGPGGVGKTTTSAALSLAAARHGLRVAALTVDPARRLADSLGLMDFQGQAQEVDPKVWAGGASAGSGHLTVIMQDTKQTFDEFVTRHAPSTEVAERILSNTLYRYISSYLAGAHEYMAMEKLLSVKDDPRFDLVVLDTPPTESAVDFLTAPERLLGAVDGAVVRWLAAAFDPSRGLSMNLLAKGVARILNTMGRITGREFLDQMARFVADFNSLFGGLRERAGRVANVFRGADFGFVLVASPTQEAVDESLRLARYLASERMSVGALVINRVHEPRAAASSRDILERLERSPGPLTRERLAALADKALQAQAERAGFERADGLAIQRLEAEAQRMPSLQAAPLIRVPELQQDVQSLQSLHEIARVLWAD